MKKGSNDELPDITLIKEGSVYKATSKRRKDLWYVPYYRPGAYVTAIDFINLEERHLDVIRAGDIIIEVGATTGEYTVPAAKRVGQKGQIYAFEASPLNYICLVKNICSRQLTYVIPINKAVSSRSHEVLYLARMDQKRMMGVQTRRKERDSSITVATTSLDDYAQSIELEKVDLLKLTANGFEPDILRGCERVLHNVRAVLFQTGYYEESISLLEARSFRVSKIREVDNGRARTVLMERTT